MKLAGIAFLFSCICSFGAFGETLVISEGPFPYRIAEASNISLEEADGTLRGSGSGAFRIVLEPFGAESWDMARAALIGLEFTNTSDQTIVVDLRILNEDATSWSNSVRGRTIVQPSESVPLAVPLARNWSVDPPHPAYLRMFGRPDGSFRHWQSIQPERVVRWIVQSNGEGSHTFVIGPMRILKGIQQEMLGKFPVMDRFGQYRLADWEGKLQSVSELRDTLTRELELESSLPQIPARSPFGGWSAGPQLEATGRFRVEEVDGKWWFVDPEGFLFWSFGVTGIGVDNAGWASLRRDPRFFAKLPAMADPELGRFYGRASRGLGFKEGEWPSHYHFKEANAYLKYGDDWREKATLQTRRRLDYSGINTFGAWSRAEMMASARLPYTVMLHPSYDAAADKLPDPFSPRTRAGIRNSIQNSEMRFAGDPRCLGVFVHNELHWKSSDSQLVREILTFGKGDTPGKRAIGALLENRYSTLEEFNTAWGLELDSWDQFPVAVSGAALNNLPPKDCEEIAYRFAREYFKTVHDALAEVDPEVLYMGSRFHQAGEGVLRAASEYLDVISANIYEYSPELRRYGGRNVPVLITEYHFGNLTGSNLGSGLRSAQNSVQQARLMRQYLEEAIADPQIVGAHWFQWHDQNVGGRGDGENYDIGFIDIVDQPEPRLMEAAARFGAEMYRLR